MTLGTGLADSAFDSLDVAHIVRNGAGGAALASAQAVVLQLFAEDLAGIDGHRAVEENRYVAEAAARLEAVEMKEEGLGPANSERRDHDRSATAYRFADDFRQSHFGIASFVSAIAVGRFDKQIVGLINRDRVDHDWVIISAKITREDRACASPVELNRGGTEDVACPPQFDGRSARDVLGLIECYGLEPLEHAHGIVECVERECRLVFGKAVAVCVLGVLFLQVARVRQQYLAERGCRLGAEDRASEAMLDQ